MKTYTVIVIYPDYAADNYGEEFYIDTVYAPNPAAAIQLTQKQAAEANSSIESPADFALVACFEGDPEMVARAGDNWEAYTTA